MNHRLPHPIRVLPLFCALLSFFGCSVSFAEDSLDPLDALPKSVGGVSVTLPRPSMPDGLDAEAQAIVLTTVAGKYPLDRFAKDSIVAPFRLERTTIKDSEGQRVGHQVDLWFIAYGALDTIGEQGMFAELIESDRSDGGSGDAVPDPQLTKRGLKTVNPPDHRASLNYYRFQVPVLDRVLVEGVARTQTKASEESHLASVTLEAAFDGDETFANRWRPAKTDGAEPIAYSGYGAYAKATRLKGFPDAILIECHGIVHEPEGWFGGANLLGSKLPIAIQNSVRSFRRTLGKKK